VLLHPGRRHRGRRAGETRDIYVDVYHPRDVLLLLAVLLLNVLDAAFTLVHLQLGGEEANPLMARLIQAGEETFLFEKSFVVGVWLVLLVAHKRFLLARAGLFVLLALYLGLFVFHIYIVSLR